MTSGDDSRFPRFLRHSLTSVFILNKVMMNCGFFVTLNNKVAMGVSRALLYGTSVSAKNRNSTNADVYNAK